MENEATRQVSQQTRQARNALDRAIREKAHRLGMSEYELINRVKVAVWELEIRAENS